MSQMSQDPLAQAVAQQPEVTSYHYAGARGGTALLYLGLVASGILVVAQSVFGLIKTPWSATSLLGTAFVIAVMGQLFYPVRSICCDARGVRLNYWLGSRTLLWQEITELRLEPGNNTQLCVLRTKDLSLRFGIDGVWGIRVLRDWRTFARTVVERASLQFAHSAERGVELHLPSPTRFLKTFGYSGIESVYVRPEARA